MDFIEGKPNPNLGEMVGSELAQGLNQLMQLKMAQTLERHKQQQVGQAYQKLLGQDITPEQAQALAYMPKENRMDILREVAMRNQQQQYGKQQGQPNFQNLMGGLSPQPQAQGMRYPQQMGRIPFETPQMTQTRLKEQQRQYEHQQAGQEKQWESNRREAKPYVAELRKLSNSSTQVEQNALRAIELIKKGNTAEGLKGGYLPLKLQNADTRELNTLFEAIAASRAEMQTGPMSRARIMLAQRQKASIDMPKKAQLDILYRTVEDARKGKAYYGLFNEAIRANEGKYPADLETMINEEFARRYPQHVEGGTQANGIPGQGVNPEQTQIPQEENLLGQAVRTGVGAAARVGEGAITGLGNIVGAAATGIDYLGQAGGYSPELRKKVEKYSPLPTSDMVQKKLSEWTNGYTDPKSGTEQFLYDVASIFGSLFMPGAVAPKLVSALTKAGMTAEKALKTGKILLPFSGYVGSWKPLLKASIAGEGVAKLAEGAGAGPVVQTILKAGTMMATATAGTRARLAKVEEESWKEASSGFGDVKINVKNEISRLTNLENQAMRQAHRYSEEEIEMIRKAKTGLQMSKKNNYMMKVKDLISQNKELNRRFKESTLPRVPSEKYTPAAMRSPIRDTKAILDAPIARASKISPETKKAFDAYTLAKDHTAALAQRNVAAKFFEKHAGTTGLFSAHHGMFQTVLNVLKNGLAYAGRDAFKVVSLFKTDIGRKAYIGAMEAAARNDMNAFMEHMSRMTQMLS